MIVATINITNGAYCLKDACVTEFRDACLGLNTPSPRRNIRPLEKVFRGYQALKPPPKKSSVGGVRIKNGMAQWPSILIYIQECLCKKLLS